MHAPAASADLARKSLPWIFYGQTTSLCETCFELVPAKIIGEDGAVFLQKRCLLHGVTKTLIEEDADYWLDIRPWLKPGDRPLYHASRTERGCPWDCGLCPDHEQHSCLAIVEINDACNLSCPVCFADSAVGRGGHRPLAEVEAMLDAVVRAEGEPDLVQLSGGEPTIHPEFWEIVAAARARPIRHLMVNTNGLSIAQEEGFAERCAAVGPGFEIYLQFDSLDDDNLMALRGARLGRIRRQALERLEAAGVSTTLVCAVRAGVNDAEVAAIVDHALTWKCVRGVVFQPVQDAGRNEGFDPALHRATLSGLRRRISAGGVFAASDLVPLPCNPDQICIGYGIRSGASVVPVTRLMGREDIVASAPNTISFERDPQLKKRVFELLSLSTVEGNGESRLASLFCCLPGIEAPASLAYKDTFKVAIIQFLDRYNFDLGTVKRSCIHFATPDGRLIPFDTYNSFYRPGAAGAAKLIEKGGVPA
ncbi:MAG: 7,8-dihydro-6-hydroxymethylpterin dimethyltransferase [Sphingomonadales bacterium]|jgi:uncharacterized radical SAM superfamily Fe-S cluster-containing enzyme|nr:7,8-dihydro-6-hydroxymethylpterin dimethyltransferase [Sphingomonadales bacterium]